MALLNKSYLRGFLIPTNFTEDDIDKSSIVSIKSNYTEEETIADTPEPIVSSKLYVGSNGTTDPNTDLQIVTKNAGLPRTATYLVKDNYDSTTTLYGNNQRINISDFEMILYETATIKVYNKDMLSFSDGSLLMALEKSNSAASGPQIVVYRRSKNGVLTNSTVHTYTGTVAFGNKGNPALVQLEDNSILLIITTVDDDKVNILVYRSTDQGVTFTLTSKQALSDEIDVSSGNYTIEKATARAHNGQILLLFSVYSSSGSHTNKNQVIQYCSIDGGGTFSLITDLSTIGNQAFYMVDLFINRNQFTAVYIAQTDEIRIIHLPHGFYSLQDMQISGKYVKANAGGSANDFATGTDTNMSDGYITGYSAYDDSINIFAKDHSDNSVVSMYSLDGTNYYSLLTNASPSTQPSVFYIGTTDVIDTFKAVSYQGGAVLLHGWNAAGNGDSAGLIFLGGYSNVTYPYRNTYYSSKVPLYRMQHTSSYLPIMTAASSSLYTQSGTGLETLNSGGYSVFTVTSAQNDYLLTKSNTMLTTKGISARVMVKVVSTATGGGSPTPAYSYISIEETNTSGLNTRYKLVVKLSTTQIFIYDTSTLIATLDFNNDQGVEFLLSIVNTKASVFYRQMRNDNLRKWITAFTDQQLTSGAVGIVTDATKIIWGIDGSPSSGTAESHWYQVTTFEAYGQGDLTDFDSNDLIGAAYPSISQKSYIDNGVSITSNNGPTYYNDQWNIKSFSFNGIGNIFYSYSPTPRVQWKSEKVSSGTTVPAQRITFNVSTNAASFGNDLIGLHLNNINFISFQLLYLSGSAWVTYQTIATYSGMRHGYLKEGNTIKQDTTTIVDQSYYFFDELKDCIAHCVGTGFSEHIRIIGNTEGGFGNVSGKQCFITLESEPTGNGQVFIIPKALTVVASLNGIKSSKWAISITSQSTIDDQFRIGQFCMGPVVITGTQYSKGRRITIESGTITTATQDKVNHSRNLAPSQRTVEISWSDGVDQSAFYNNNPDPDYYKSSSSVGSQPISAYQDAPYLMEGVLRRLKGNNKPLVYLPSITTSNDVRIYNRSAQHMLSTLNSEVTITSITGEELRGDGTGEVMRVGTIDLLEVV